MKAASWGLLGYLAAQRLWELARARKNERAMEIQGGREHAAGHYPVLFLVHVAFFLAVAARISAGARLSSRSLPWLAAFALAQGLRFWAVASLGPAWSTRVWTVPGRALTRTGPYRFLRHPIYAAVVIEVLSIPLAYGLLREAVLFSALNALLLAVRIPAEERALRSV